MLNKDKERIMKMSKVAVVFWSGTGNTEAMANAVLEGAKAKGAEATLFEASGFNKAKAAEFDAIALGCPAMGAEVLEEAEFQPMFDDVKSALSGKKVALFGSYGWGDGEWMRNWEEEVRGLGANMVAEGLMVNEAPDDAGLEQCKELGGKLA